MPLRAPRLTNVVLATAIALSGAAVSAAVTAPTAHAVTAAASSVDGPITRQEVIARAKYWLSKADDGEFGRDTESAVKQFQSAKGLEVDDRVGPNTWAALRSST